MTSRIKEGFDLTIGKAASFFGDQKERAAEFLDDKKELYETKKSLDEANTRLEALFNELGRVCFYGGSTVPGRRKADIQADITVCLETVDALQARYNELNAN